MSFKQQFHVHSIILRSWIKWCSKLFRDKKAKESKLSVSAIIGKFLFQNQFCLDQFRMGVWPSLSLIIFLLVMATETKKNGNKMKEFKTCVSGFCLEKNYRLAVI